MNEHELMALRCIAAAPELLAGSTLRPMHFSDATFRDAYRAALAMHKAGQIFAGAEIAKYIGKPDLAGKLTDASVYEKTEELFLAHCESIHAAFKGSQNGRLLASLDARRVKAATPPPEPTPRFYLAGKVIATPGNLCNFIAKSKAGKTAGLGGVIASAVAESYGRTGLDTLGFKASDPAGKALVVMDTEQSTYDAWKCLRRGLDRAEQDEDPPWLYVYGLAGYTAPELREALSLIAEAVSYTHGGIFAMCLDGVADFVTDVNDPKESNALVASLHHTAITYDCSILNVIHLNEGRMAGDDARGHLGKQLTRKGESNLLMQKDGDITTITSDRQRNAPITVEDGVAFRWSDEEGRHVSCAGPAESKQQAKKAELSELAAEAFGHDRHLKYTDLVARIMKARDCSKNTADRRITEMKRLGVIKSGLMGFYERVV